MAAFIPKQYKKEQFTIRLEQGMLEQVDLLAEQYQLSRSEFIAQCIRFAIENMPTQKE